MDLTDNNYEYRAGDEFPRSGLEVSAKRLHELSTEANRRGVVLIEEVAEAAKKPAKRAKKDVD
jgi:hypothetical protein